MNRRTFAAYILVGLWGCERRRSLSTENLTPDQKLAVALAKALLADQKFEWGEPIAIKPLRQGWEPVMGEGPGCFVVVFETPEKELPLLGDRAVLVNATTGKAMIAPRE